MNEKQGYYTAQKRYNALGWDNPTGMGLEKGASKQDYS